MQQWEKAIFKGNRAFDEDRDDVATRIYTTPWKRVLLLLSHWADTEAAIAALVMSHQKIEDVYFRKHNHSQAINTYKDLYQQLKSYYLIDMDTSNIISAFYCASQRAGTELAATVKRLGISASMKKSSFMIFSS